MNPIEKIRAAFKTIKSIIKVLPSVISEFKKDTEIHILKDKIHETIDETFDMYGNVIISICKNIDATLIENLITDITLLAAKYKEPLKEQGNLIISEIKPITEKYAEKLNKSNFGFDKVFQRMVKRNNWEEKLGKVIE